MEGFGRFGFLHRARAFLILIPLLLVILGLPHLKPAMPTMWHALHGVFERPASAFMLLNCVVATIIASSKLERDRRGAHVEEGKREAVARMERGDERREFVSENDIVASSELESGSPNEEESCKREAMGQNIERANYEQGGFVSESVNIGQSRHDTAPMQNESMIEGGNFVKSSCSLNTESEKQTDVSVSEKKRIRRARHLARRGNERVGQLHSNKPPRTEHLKEKKLIRADGFSFRGSDQGNCPAKLALEQSFDNTAEEKCAEAALQGEMIAHQPRQAGHSRDAAAAAHPSSEDVWAAIMASSKSRHRTPPMQAEKRTKEPNRKDVARLQPAAATSDEPAQPAAAAPALPPAPAAKPLKAAAARPSAGITTSKAHAAASTEKQEVERANDQQESDRELEELNRRAEEFIARFNHQMHLQRQESLQRQRGRRPCNYDIQRRPHQLPQLSARGLLVG